MKKILIGSFVLITLVIISFIVYWYLTQEFEKECIKITGIRYEYIPHLGKEMLTFESQRAFNTSGYKIETKVSVDDIKKEIVIETIRIVPPSPDEKIYPTPTLPAAYIDIENTDYNITIYSCNEKFTYQIINDTMVRLNE